MRNLLIAFLFAASGAAAQSYVGSDTCVGCHTDQGAEWTGSHHDLAWTEPSDATVLADFDGTSFAHDGMEVSFRRDADGFYASVTEKDGVQTEYPVHSVVGVAPLQQYLFETAPETLQSFDVVWDTERREWYHLYPDQDLPPDDGLHWTGPYKNWNARCAECHATGYKRNYGPRTRSYASVQSEIGVGCEACHGPGSKHVDLVTTKAAPEEGYGFTMQWGKGDTEAEIQQCAGCHSRREPLADGNPVPGTPFADAYTLALLRPGAYHADGQILDEVYVYGSFLQSKMYAQGVGCMNCHNPHTAEVELEGNAVCTQCHSEGGNPDFPSLRLALYDDPSHTHHPMGSEGAQCKSCHMIERDYMGVDGRRDHSFRVPRPDVGAKIGAPDACTDCHVGQGQDWAADQIAAWFPDSAHRGAHYGETFALARNNPAPVQGDLAAIALDKAQSGLVRATALYLMQPLAAPAIADQVAPLLDNDDPLVRAGAAVLQRGADEQTRANRLMPLLGDPMKSVRIAAAKQMLDVPPSVLRPSQRALVQNATGDWQRSLATKLDYPETHLVLGGMALSLRNLTAAERAFFEVVSLDPQRSEAWVMLVRLAEAQAGADAARKTLDQALGLNPDDAALLALKAEMGR